MTASSLIHGQQRLNRQKIEGSMQKGDCLLAWDLLEIQEGDRDSQSSNLLSCRVCERSGHIEARRAHSFNLRKPAKQAPII